MTSCAFHVDNPVAIKRAKQNARQKAYRDRIRTFLFDALGRVCNNPDCRTREELTFDVIVPVGEPKEHHRYSSTQRMKFYERQHGRKNLQVLCNPCNSSKNDTVELPLSDDPY